MTFTSDLEEQRKEDAKRGVAFWQHNPMKNTPPGPLAGISKTAFALAECSDIPPSLWSELAKFSEEKRAKVKSLYDWWRNAKNGKYYPRFEHLDVDGMLSATIASYSDEVLNQACALVEQIQVEEAENSLQLCDVIRIVKSIDQRLGALEKKGKK
jgi:hypothetical protein